MKKYLVVLISVLTMFTLMSNSGCEQQKPVQFSADIDIQNQTEESMTQANNAVGMPGITNFQEKKIQKWIYELRDREDLVCYAYLMNEMNGTIGQYLGRCIGYGLPYSTQFTNPLKIAFVDGGDYGAKNPYTLPQPEPNGLFMPEGLSATWLLLIDPETDEPRPVYCEPNIIVSPFKLHK